MIPLDEESLRRAVGSAAFERGLEYVRKGRVLEANVESSGRIRGLVKGSEWKPYEQRIGLDGKAIDGFCTCPIGENCKHVAAVLLDLMGQDEVVELPPEKADPRIASWLGSLDELFADPNAYPSDVAQRVLYILARDEKGLFVELVSARALRDGGFGKSSRLSLNPLYSKTWPRYVLPVDMRLIEALVRGFGRTGYESKFRLAGADGGRLMPELVSTGRLYWESPEAPLERGPDRRAALAWTAEDDGAQTLRLDAAGLLPFPTAPPWYLDPAARLVGELDLGLPAPYVATLLDAPSIRPESVATVRSALAGRFPNRPDLLPFERPIERRQVRPVPIFRVEVLPCEHVGYGAARRPSPGGEYRLPVGRLTFDYDGIEVRQGAPGGEVRRSEDDGIVVMPRRTRLEGRAATPLLEAGWTTARSAHGWRPPKGHADDYLFPPESDAHPEGYRTAFFRFLQKSVPALREAGWRVELAEGVDLVEPVEWRVELRDEGTDWFDLDLGVIVDGERIPLRPILLSALAGLKGGLNTLRDDDSVYHALPDGRTLALPATRVRPLLKALVELFGRVGDWPSDLGLTRARAAELAVFDESGLEWRAPERLQELRDRLRDFGGLSPVAPPASLQGDLRPYQRQGLAWLQFLREFGFGGILADDMGLGKTVQTLAHLLVEQEAGRLDRPVLIVAPTSTLPNWRAEAARFAPSLKVLVLRGADRHAHFDEIETHDLILTSFPLLARDREELAKHEFHLVVLDEAQNIKNPAAAAAKAAKALRTRHRVCLSGTPVENRLEELWSLFDFLMPGFLGGITRFRKEFRNPVERHGDEEAAHRLARRVRPFVLRRTKDLVATELPEKTTVVERVELEGEQRDLYESLRLAMDKRVRELVASKGLDRGRIEILDALLKLRQACCDPRLVKLDAAKGVSGSAKLERLMELLAEALSEGRRVLLFSQFTSMLDLIEEALKASPLLSGGEESGVRGGENQPNWVRLDGSTEDREAPVRRFQAGEVPLFLVSLRAGGTGLNLTAADTVIHYDPWWNPAVEAQATDRAHRIGQTKAVLVLKLVAEGTVEERILELQDRKAKLAGSILDGGGFEASLSPDELHWVLAGETPSLPESNEV